MPICIGVTQKYYMEYSFFPYFTYLSVEAHSPPTLHLLENSVPEFARPCFYLQLLYSLKMFYSGLQIHTSLDIWIVLIDHIIRHEQWGPHKER